MITTLRQITRERDFETPSILKALATAHRHLGELKGVSAGMPNEHILISTLTLQESQDRPAIETKKVIILLNKCHNNIKYAHCLI